MEKILCAAIWYKEQKTAKQLPRNIKQGVVVCGFGHAHCIHCFVALTGKRSVTVECGEYEQGFLTSENRFVDRKEALSIAMWSGQIEISHKKTELYSEDLY